jgi:IstB-like ATP binding protein
MKTAAFPVIKTLDELDRSACSIPGPTLDYLASLEWITAKENLCLVGPPVIHGQVSCPGRTRRRRGPQTSA